METLPSGLPEHIDDGEALARFLTQSNQFNSVMAKPAAFLPNPKDGETSVFRHGREPEDSLWQLGRGHAAGNRTLHGAAIVKAKYIRAVQLDVIAKEPPPRHANITRWPWLAADPEMGRAERKDLANQIAQHAELLLC